MLVATQRVLGRLGQASSILAERYLPDAWIYAVFLTFIAYFGAIAIVGATPLEAARAWQKELWNKDILVLIAQFSINLTLCTAMARAPGVSRVLTRIASAPSSAFQAIALITFVSIGLGLVSWALAVAGGALFAQEVCRRAKQRGIAVHFPLAVAAGYVGMMTWGCGLTSSAPLISATPGHFLEGVIGVVPVSQTLGSAANLFILAVLAALCPFFMASLHPSERNPITEFKGVGLAEAPIEEAAPGAPARTFADRVETSPWVLKAASLFPLAYLVQYYGIDRKGITIDSMNLAFLCVVMLAYRTPRHMLAGIAQASGVVWGVVFQFPFYAGLMGLIKGTGLGLWIANALVGMSSAWTWPTIGLATQAILNVFIPSGGTQWIVTGEVLSRANQAFGYSHAFAILIEVMADQVANMITPMWALPALALTGLRARDILGYTAMVMILGFVVMAAGLTLFRF